MRRYLSVAVAEFKRGWQYHYSAIMSMPLYFLRGLLSIAIICAFSAAQRSNLTATSNYLWLINLFYPVVSAWVVDYDLNTMIKSGNVAYEYIKPLDIYSSWFTRLLSRRVSQLCLASFPVIIFAGLLPGHWGFHVHATFLQWVIFLFLIALALCLNVVLSLLVYISVFYTYSITGSLLVFGSIMEFMGGTVIPFSFFPTGLQGVFRLFPFWYGAAFPFQYLTGGLSWHQLYVGVGAQLVWLVVLIAGGRGWLNHRLHCIVIQGG